MEGYIKDGYTWFIYKENVTRKWIACCPMHNRQVEHKFKDDLLQSLLLDESHSKDFLGIAELANKRINRPI